MSNRATWKGVLSFGLVNIPVQTYSAVKDENDRVSFKQVHVCKAAVPAKGRQKEESATVSQVKMPKVCTGCKRDLEAEDISKGYEYAKGQFVVVTKEEFAGVSVEGSKALAIEEFVPVDQVPARYMEKPYFLAPQPGSESGYALVREALRKTGTMGVCNATLRENSSHLAAVGVEGDALVLYLLRYAPCVVDPGTLTLPGRDVSAQALKLAQQLIGGMLDEFQPEKYRDQYAESVRELVQRKMEGKPIEVKAAQEASSTAPVDLMAKLQESIAKPKGKGKLRKSAAA